MNYAFHIDLGDMPYDKWHAMYSAPENKAKRAEWWGPEHIGKSGENSAVILAQIGVVRQTSPSISIHLTSMSTRSLKNATR